MLKENKGTPFVDLFSIANEETPYSYFERLPLGFNEDLMQYELQDFAYTTAPIKNANVLENLYLLREEDAYVQFI